MLQLVAEYLGWIVAIVGALGTLFVVARRSLRKAGGALAKGNQVFDVMLGRPAILHPETGEVLVPETPGIGTRMAHIESWQTRTDVILEKMADTTSELVRTNRRIDTVHDKLNRHLDGICVHCSAGAQVELKIQDKPA